MANKDELRAIYQVLKRLTNLVVEIVKNPNDDQPLNQRPRRESWKKREFTPIGMSYDAAFDYLYANGMITPIGPIRELAMEKHSPSWNPNTYCKYHQRKGHSTEQCWTLKHFIQDLIDSNQLHVHLSRQTSRFFFPSFPQ